MRKRFHITPSTTTHEERLKQLGIPKAREKELQALADQFMAEYSRLDGATANVIAGEKRRKRASAA